MEQPNASKDSLQTAESATTAEAMARAGGDETGLAMNYCPRCSARLASRSCKLICPDCGYYMSCSDFY
jgi:hypothetical protein